MFRTYNFNGDVDGLLKNLFGDVVNSVKEHAEYLIADIKETATSFVLSADVPGVNKDEITIDLLENELKITTPERKLDVLQDGEKLLLAQRTTSKKIGKYRFPKDIDAESIKASFKDGVLVVEIQKKEKSTVVKKVVID